MSKKSVLILGFIFIAFYCFAEDPATKPEGVKQSPHLYPVTVDGKLGYIDKTGKIVIEPKFQFKDFMGLYFSQFSDGLAFVSLNNKFGYIDKTGKIVIETKFDEVREFSEGLARVKIEGEYGFIDKQGNIVIKPEFKKASDFSEGLATVEILGRWGYIDKEGQVVIKKQFDSANEFYEGLAWVKINDKWSCIEKQGNVIFSLKKKDLHVLKFTEGVACVSNEKECRYIDKTGKTVIESNFEEGLVFTEGLAGVSTGGTFKNNHWTDEKWGYIDKTGKFVIEPKYNQAYPFSNGLAAVVLKEKGKDYQVGYIDKTGKYVIEPMTLDAGDKFNEEGIAQVSIFGKDKKGAFRGYINTKGEYIWKPSR